MSNFANVFIRHLGKKTIHSFGTLGGIVGLYLDTLAGFLSKRGRRSISSKQIIDQLLFTGVDALFPVGLIAFSCGMIIAIQATTSMPQFGVGDYFGKVMVIALVRELGPFFTSLVVIGRSGAALAAYIGNMKVTKEIASLESMGIDFIHFQIMPTFAGMVLSMFCLNLYFDLVGVLGGLAVADSIAGESFISSVQNVLNALYFRDIISSMLKSVFFGSVIAIISCYHGLLVDNIRMVPRAVFRTVVGALGTTILVNMIATVLFYVVLS